MQPLPGLAQPQRLAHLFLDLGRYGQGHVPQGVSGRQFQQQEDHQRTERLAEDVPDEEHDGADERRGMAVLVRARGAAESARPPGGTCHGETDSVD